MGNFRFEDLEIWNLSIEICDVLFEIADKLENKKHYKFAEQIRAAGLSMPNNIAEGSGSYSEKEFAYFINISRRSAFECANMVIILNKRNILDDPSKKIILNKIRLFCQKAHHFRRRILK
ncbi:four helix bundle protein [Bacteroidota bacterium]